VTTMLGVHRKYHALVSSSFNNDSGFVASLDKVRTSPAFTYLLHCKENWSFWSFVYH